MIACGVPAPPPSEGDSTCVVRALLAAQAAAVAAQTLPSSPGLVLVPMVDAAAVASCVAAMRSDGAEGLGGGWEAGPIAAATAAATAVVGRTVPTTILG